MVVPPLHLRSPPCSRYSSSSSSWLPLSSLPFQSQIHCLVIPSVLPAIWDAFEGPWLSGQVQKQHTTSHEALLSIYFDSCLRIVLLLFPFIEWNSLKLWDSRAVVWIWIVTDPTASLKLVLVHYPSCVMHLIFSLPHWNSFQSQARLKAEHLFPSKTPEPCVTAVSGSDSCSVGCRMTLSTLSEKTGDSEEGPICA